MSTLQAGDQGSTHARPSLGWPSKVQERHLLAGGRSADSWSSSELQLGSALPHRMPGVWSSDCSLSEDCGRAAPRCEPPANSEGHGRNSWLSPSVSKVMPVGRLGLYVAHVAWLHVLTAPVSGSVTFVSCEHPDTA